MRADPFKHVAAELTDAVNGMAVRNGVPWRLICGLGGFWTIIVVTAGAVIVIPAVGTLDGSKWVCNCAVVEDKTSHKWVRGWFRDKAGTGSAHDQSRRAGQTCGWRWVWHLL